MIVFKFVFGLLVPVIISSLFSDRAIALTQNDTQFTQSILALQCTSDQVDTGVNTYTSVSPETCADVVTEVDDPLSVILSDPLTRPNNSVIITDTTQNSDADNNENEGRTLAFTFSELSQGTFNALQEKLSTGNSLVTYGLMFILFALVPIDLLLFNKKGYGILQIGYKRLLSYLFK